MSNDPNIGVEPEHIAAIFVAEDYEYKDDQARNILVEPEVSRQPFRDAWRMITGRYKPKVKVKIKDDPNILYAVMACESPRRLSSTESFLIERRPWTKEKVMEYTREDNLLLEAERSEPLWRAK